MRINCVHTTPTPVGQWINVSFYRGHSEAPIYYPGHASLARLHNVLMEMVTEQKVIIRPGFGGGYFATVLPHDDR